LSFDLTSHASFEHCVHWLEEAKQAISAKSVVILVGNKSDLLDEYGNKKGRLHGRDFKVLRFL
jgi:GTPase SAR1 family protein